LSPPGLEVEALPEGGALVSAASLERAAQRQDSTKAKASLALSWSGGKDSALALLALRAEFGRDPCALITTVTDTYNRISMHGVRRELLALQAQELGLPLVEVLIPLACPNEVYDARMHEAFASERLRQVAEVAFGDLFLEEVRAYREGRLAAAGKRGLFPLWGRDTTQLARHFIKAGFQAVLVCVDPRKLDPAFAGRSYDERLLAELPPEVDACGENGEFHTFVHCGPIFRRPIACALGDIVKRDGFVFADLTAA
jgi:uncharacterized protein (TIGR00290 family)